MSCDTWRSRPRGGWVSCCAASWRIGCGPPHGLLALVLLAASPVYMAHAMNNPKDIPFATAATALLLALTRVRASTPFLSWRLVLVLALIIGASLNVRPGGLLFVGYLAVLVLFRILSTGPLRPSVLVAIELRLAAVVVGAVAIGWVAWPWAYANPLVAPFKALAELGHFGWGGTVLFDGRTYAGTSLPRWYVPQWFWLVLSPVVLVGLALSLLRLRELEIRGQVIAMWAAVLFPIVYVIGTHATLYDGIRHLLFVLLLQSSSPVPDGLVRAAWRVRWHVRRCSWRSPSAWRSRRCFSGAIIRIRRPTSSRWQAVRARPMRRPIWTTGGLDAPGAVASGSASRSRACLRERLAADRPRRPTCRGSRTWC